ncbi:MAG: amidohydrolase family protein [Acidobacteria bacterium]|nr:amidohydrolase family protein [Acidobacteriota bacterium]
MKKFILRFSVAIFAFVILSLSVSAQSRTDVFAITNARIVPVAGPNIARGTVVIRSGLIEAVGENAKVPADARIIDGTGLVVYPGFFDAYTNLGIPAPTPTPQRIQGQPQTQTQPQTQNQPPSNSNYPDGLRAEESAAEKLKAGEAQFETNRNVGFTTALTVSKDGIFNGQSAVVNLAGDSVSAMIIRAPFAEHITFTTLRGGQYPTSLLGTFSALRQMFLDAQRLQTIQKMYEKDPRGLKRPEDDKSLQALFSILNGEMPVVFNANKEIEIIRALDLAREFNLKAIIAGGQEAWKVAGRLKAQNVPVLLSLDFPKRTASASAEADPEPIELLRLRAETPKTATKLAQAGVKFAFQSGGMKNITDFLTNANEAVKNGLNKTDAIRAMTLSPAEIFGVENRLGSIEKGKIANLVVVKGDVFDKSKVITQVFVDGKLFEPKAPPKPDGKTPTGTTQPGTAAIVGGNYSINVEIPGQPIQGTLNLTQQNENLTGTFQSQLGNVPIKDGRVTAEGFSFTVTVDFGGSEYDVLVKGTVSGNQISGTFTSPQGAVPFSGTKTP